MAPTVTHDKQRHPRCLSILLEGDQHENSMNAFQSSIPYLLFTCIPALPVHHPIFMGLCILTKNEYVSHTIQHGISSITYPNHGLNAHGKNIIKIISCLYRKLDRIQKALPPIKCSIYNMFRNRSRNNHTRFKSEVKVGSSNVH